MDDWAPMDEYGQDISTRWDKVCMRLPIAVFGILHLGQGGTQDKCCMLMELDLEH